MLVSDHRDGGHEGLIVVPRQRLGSRKESATMWLTFFRKYSVKSPKSFVRGMHRKPNGSCVSTSGSKQNQAWNSLRRWNKPRYCCSRVAHCEGRVSVSSCRSPDQEEREREREREKRTEMSANAASIRIRTK